MQSTPPGSQETTVLIGADICPIGANQSLFESGASRELFNDLLSDFQQASLVVANLECPLVEARSPIQKTGPNFDAPIACIKGIKNAGIHILNLANNHILDQGGAGLMSTLKTCAEAGISTVGAGINRAEARSILVRRCGEIRIGFLSMAEREFSIAGKNSAGANPLDLIDFIRNVKEHFSEYDYLIVLLHGAHEFQPITPRVQETCRFLIEMGAGAVIVQHPHSLGGYENYQGGHIVYGQGALLMDEVVYRELKSFHEGFLVKLTILQNGSSKMELIPFVQSDPLPGARKMDAERENRFRESLAQRSQAITDPTFVSREWQDFCRKSKHSYVSSLLGFNRVLSRLNRNGFLVKIAYGEESLQRVRNLVRCETHREAIETILAADS